MTATAARGTAPQDQDDIQSPAVIGPMHVQDRVLGKGAASKTGWSKLTIYEKEHRLGHLADRSICTTPQRTQDEVGRATARYEAAKAFDEGWLVCNASWPSGSDLNRVRVVGCPGSFVDHQRDVKDYWRRVELHMGVNDWMICRRICGEGYKVAETIARISPSYKFSALARFREALDALIGAMAKARRA